MKRIVSTLVAVTLTMSVGMNTVLAANKGWTPPGLAKKSYELPPGIAKKVFDDLDDVQWAKRAIEKMKLKGLVKGYNDSCFAPKNAVTKMETIIMALRIMGWEKEVNSVKKLPNKYKGKEVADWAKGYVAVAYKKGILDDVDMMYFNPQEPATRHEVAKYVIRAIGYEKEAQENMNQKLSFMDAAAIPQGSVGYIYLVQKMKLMQGDDAGRFNPMGKLTRAEMAVLFHRLDSKVDSEIDQNEWKGIIYDIDEDKIILKVDGERKSFSVAEDVIVYKDDVRIRYSQLSKGSTVLLELEEGKVVYIEVLDKEEEDKIITQYSGTVIDIDKGNPIRFELKNKSMILIFEITDDVKVYFKDSKEGNFDEIKLQDSVSVVVDDRNRVRTVYVDRERQQQVLDEVEGIITDITSTYIKIDTKDKEQKYYYASIFTVYIDGVEKGFDELEEGMKAELKLKDNLIYAIDARSNK